MTQSGVLVPSWQPLFLTSSPLNLTTPYDHVMDFSCSSLCPEESSSSYVPNLLPDQFLDLENFSALEGLESISSGEMEDICEWINGYDTEGNSTSSFLTIEGSNEWSPCPSQESCQDSITTTAFPVIDMLMDDDHLRLSHLFKAYGEAIENGEKDLADVIEKSINEKSSPIGSTLQRVAYNLFLSGQEQSEYLRMEACKNFIAAFKVLCQTLPNSRFAHFIATSTILESIPHDVERIRIIDFQIGEGIQWPPVIEALAGKQKQVWLTSVKSDGGCDSYSCWNFEDTKKRLLCHARQCGVNLQIDERSINEVMQQDEQEWVVFNCMVGLPHMAGRRTKRSVAEFLKVAKEVVENGEGIVVVGDGEAGEYWNRSSVSYSSYFENLLRHYNAVFESLEMNFPVYLAEARTAMENLFLSPLMCPEAWFEEWKEMKVAGEMEMKRGRHSEESFGMAKQMVNEEENCWYKVERVKENEMVLQWKDTALVTVSIWM